MKEATKELEVDVISPALLIIVVIMVSSLLIANILANRMIQVGRWAMDAGALTFPITYIVSDIVSEVYGYRWSRRLSVMSATVNFVCAILIMMAMKLPAPVWFDASPFSLALNGSMRIVIASLISFVIGDWIDDVIFEKLRQRNNSPEKFKVRAILSSLGGAVIDTSLFIVIAFAFTMPHSEIPPMIILGVVGKIAYEIAILPVTGLLLKKVQEHERVYMETGGGKRYASLNNRYK